MYFFHIISHTILERKVLIMAKNKTSNAANSQNCGKNCGKNASNSSNAYNANNASNSSNAYNSGSSSVRNNAQSKNSVDPLSESTRPRKDGPGGN